MGGMVSSHRDLRVSKAIAIATPENAAVQIMPLHGILERPKYKWRLFHVNAAPCDIHKTFDLRHLIIERESRIPAISRE
jgi:hypothetical protein